MAETIYDFKVLDINEKEFDFSLLKGKTILIVNTASKCGFTKQFKELEELYEKYKNQNFIVVGFPCNQFLMQEPGDANEIMACALRYGVSFPMMSKIKVNGKDAHPIYVYLKSQKEGRIKWNFTKFLIDKNGNVVERFEPQDNPISFEGTIVKFL